METKVIHITHEMPVETLNDLADTAQGGIGYWAIPLNDPSHPHRPVSELWTEFDESDGSPFGEKFALNADLILKGIEAFSKADSAYWHRVATDVIDGGAAKIREDPFSGPGCLFPGRKRNLFSTGFRQPDAHRVNLPP